MFFLFLERSGGKRIEYQWLVSISFSGEKKGYLKVYFSEGITGMMVQNMLNVPESEVTQRLREDCMKESVNMICGDFLRNFDPARVFDLSLPVVENGAGGIMDDQNDEDDTLAFTFESGSGMLGVVLMFK
jgi:CheY-specific phosphatase CheX